MHMEGHGGGCCGMRHLHDFSGSDNNVLKEVKLYLRRTNKRDSGAANIENMSIIEGVRGEGRKRGKIIEIVLTDGQVEALPKTCLYLKEYGFKLVHRFDNATGNICNVLHYCFSTLPNEKSPFENLPKVKKSPVVQQEERRVPQVGEVWRINRNTHPTALHDFPKNLYVIIRGVDTSDGSFSVESLRDRQVRYHSVTLDVISFIRSEA